MGQRGAHPKPVILRSPPFLLADDEGSPQFAGNMHWPAFLTTGPEGRGFTGCGKTPPCCHSERSEESRSEYFQRSARFLVLRQEEWRTQNDSVHKRS